MTIENAIILAAGQGKRLLPYTKDRPKCLLDFGGKSLIEIQLAAFSSCGIRNVTVVVGYRGDLVMSRLGNAVSYVTNDRYEDTSSMYSLWLARESFSGGCIVLNSDVLFHPGILRRLLDSESPNALAMDFHARLNEEEMKVRVEGRRVKGLSKSFVEADGENVGMLKFDKTGWSLLMETIEAFLREGHEKEMVPFAVDAISSKCFIEAVPVNHLPWIEIDFPEDYERAVNEIYPSVKAALFK
ncbi:MAG: NTP transferase domain-containing protein [Thermodesulforhabdaceae bacterium]|jgi:choline kinase